MNNKTIGFHLSERKKNKYLCNSVDLTVESAKNRTMVNLLLVEVVAQQIRTKIGIEVDQLLWEIVSRTTAMIDAGDEVGMVRRVGRDEFAVGEVEVSILVRLDVVHHSTTTVVRQAKFIERIGLAGRQ